MRSLCRTGVFSKYSLLFLWLGLGFLMSCRDRDLDDLENYHQFVTTQASPQLQRFAKTLEHLQQTKDLEKLRVHVQQRIVPELSKYVQQLQSLSPRSATLRKTHETLIQAYRDILTGLTSFVQEAQDETQRISQVIALRQKAQQFEQKEQRYHRELRAWIHHVQQRR